MQPERRIQSERRFVWRGEADGKGPEAPHSAGRRAGDNSPPCRILVVDDDVMIRAQLCALLHASGYEVETAASGDAALTLLRTSPCDIVVTDWHMPRMDGVTLCRQLRATDDHAYVFLLMFTIKQSPQELLAGFAAGVDDYVVKGTSNEELLARLETGRRIANRRAKSAGTEDGVGAQSLIDVPTGTYNLLYMLQHLPRELARSERYGHSLALLSCELSEAIRAHERSEQVASEAIARHFSSSTTPCLRKADWLTRTGRKEFMIVLPETDRKGALCVARKLRNAFGRLEAGAVQRQTEGTVRIDITAFTPLEAGDGAAKIQAIIQKAELLRPAKGRAEIRRADAGATHYLSDLVVEQANGGRDWPAT